MNLGAKWADLSVSKKLMFGFGTLLFFLIGTGVLALRQMASTDQSVHYITDVRLVGMEAGVHFGKGILVAQGAIRGAVNPDASDQIRALRVEQAQKGLEEMRGGMEQYRALDGQFLADLEAKGTEYIRYAEFILAQIQSGELTAAAQYMRENEANVYEPAVELAYEMQDYNEEAIHNEIDDMFAGFAKDRTLIIGFLIVAVVAAVLIARVVSKGLNTSIAAIKTSIEAIEEGDFTKPARIHGRDEIGQMGELLNQAVGKIGDSMKKAIEIARDAAESAEKLSHASQQVGAGTEQIAQTIEQVASGATATSQNTQDTSANAHRLDQEITNVSQIMARVKTKLDESTQALNKVASQAEDSQARMIQSQELAEAVDTVANEGATKLRKSVEGMRKIESSSNQAKEAIQKLEQASAQISAIVDAISDISEQTNLLALNAAIEAARAGEHGRGFAVVAEEVRKLSERSTRETKEIEGIIANIQALTVEAVTAVSEGSEQVASGSQMVEEASESLVEIQTRVSEALESIRLVAKSSGEVSQRTQQLLEAVKDIQGESDTAADATEQMAQASDAVMRSIEEVSAISEENAAASEEVAAATEENSATVQEMVSSITSLSDRAAELQATMEQFKVDGSTAISNSKSTEAAHLRVA